MSVEDHNNVPDVEYHNPKRYPPTLDMNRVSPIVLGRVNALKNILRETVKIETDYYIEQQKLMAKYQVKYDEINRERYKVISGAHEPSGIELVYDSEEYDTPEEDTDEENDALETMHPDYRADVKGLPKFWLHVLKNANEEALINMIERHDEPVLAHLTDLTVSLHPDNASFTLKFSFQENPYFTNEVLTKEYYTRISPDPESPLTYNGPDFVACKGCSIDWKEGKNITTITKKVQTKDGKILEIIEESFFNFFDPPNVGDDGKATLNTTIGEDRVVLLNDFDLGQAIKTKVIPRAVLYFTGEIFDEEYDDFEDDEEDFSLE